MYCIEPVFLSGDSCPQLYYDDVVELNLKFHRPTIYLPKQWTGKSAFTKIGCKDK
jgi:hypothetical protein